MNRLPVGDCSGGGFWSNIQTFELSLEIEPNQACDRNADGPLCSSKDYYEFPHEGFHRLRLQHHRVLDTADCIPLRQLIRSIL